FYVLVAFANSSGANAGGELAHLRGGALGVLYIRLLQQGRDIGRPEKWVGSWFESLGTPKPKVKVTYRKNQFESNRCEPSGRVSVSTQEEIDKILDKIAEKGYDNLTKEEKRKLFDFSNK